MQSPGVFPRVIKVCEECHTTYVWNPKRNPTQRFCSALCRNRATAKQTQKRQLVMCDGCQKPFGRRMSAVTRTRQQLNTFCSKTCQKAYYEHHGDPRSKRVSRKCKYCHKTFLMYRSWLAKKRASGEYCSKACMFAYRRETGNPRSKRGPYDGRFTDHQGYVLVSQNGKRVREHRLIMEQMIGRPLEPWEQVHHLDSDRSHNTSENLELWAKGQPNGSRAEFYAADYMRLARERYKLLKEIEKLQCDTQARQEVVV